MRVELLTFSPQSERTSAVFAALQRSAQASGVELEKRETYRGGSDLLMLWGPGAPDRFEPMRQQVTAGHHVACFDLAYWQRDAKVRVSIDAAHPQRWVMARDWPVTRLEADQVPMADAWKPDGPVIVAGIGRKARVQYGGAQIAEWEAEMIRACRLRWPQKPVLYRRKQADAPVPAGVTLASDGPIERVLAGASLVITWHSNVAVDAIRLGIPAVCCDGAAAAVCPSTLEGDLTPLDVGIRNRFLANLAWFQWGATPAEAQGCWTFLQALLS